MLNVKPEHSGLDRKLDNTLSRMKNLPWLSIGNIARDAVHKNFVVGGRPVKWAARKKSVPWRVLRKTDGLMMSHYVELINIGVAVGNKTKPYNALQNFGYPAKNVAERKYLIVPQEDIKEILKISKNHIFK